MGNHPRADLYLAEREKGLTYREIAKKFGVSFQCVAQACGRTKAGQFRPFTEEKCVYPNLRNWLNENKVSRNEFIRRLGWIPDSPNSGLVGNYFLGNKYPQKRIIDKMLQVTGLTYEELWYREEEKEDGN